MYKCEYCNKEFEKIDYLNIHTPKCKIKIRHELINKLYNLNF